MRKSRFELTPGMVNANIHYKTIGESNFQQAKKPDRNHSVGLSRIKPDEVFGSGTVERRKLWQQHANRKIFRGIPVSEGIITKTAAYI